MAEVHLPLQDSLQAASPAAPGSLEPRLVAFVCRWCTYAGADLAGTSRMTYPPNVRTLMLPCTGRIDVAFILRAFLEGADGVLVSGCHPGDCHYTAGNYRARRRWILLRDLLDTIGVDLRRLQLAWISAAEGAKWVKTIQNFTDEMRQLGRYEPMQRLAADFTPELALADGQPNGYAALPAAAPVAVRADSPLGQALAQALQAGAVKAILGWKKQATLGRPQAACIVDPQALVELVIPPRAGNLARLFKHPEIRQIQPIGVITRRAEALAMNVLIQEKQLDPGRVVAFAVDGAGHFLGLADPPGALKKIEAAEASVPPPDPGASTTGLWAALDRLMAQPREERWAFWIKQAQKCIRCYACRGACPLCNCHECLMDKNVPQWFPTAADGPGNFAWQLIRAFHLAGRCIGCGSCQEACPAGIPLGLLDAAMMRSVWKHFGYRSGMDPAAAPLQSDFRTDDRAEFIL